MEELERRITVLVATVTHHDGRNVADRPFVQEVEALLDLFHDDIGEIKQIDLRSLFTLFLLKTLYVGRRSRSAAALNYLADLMANYLRMRDLFPLPDLGLYYAQLFSRLLEETRERGIPAQNLFEAYRKLADNTLFLMGLFPASLARRRGRGRSFAVPNLNRPYFTRLGKEFYSLAAEHELAQWVGQSDILARMAAHFETYVEALGEIATTYIHGFDVHRLADKMLDCYNLYRRTGDARHLENARKYAALLAVDRRAFLRLWRSRRRHVTLH